MDLSGKRKKMDHLQRTFEEGQSSYVTQLDQLAQARARARDDHVSRSNEYNACVPCSPCFDLSVRTRTHTHTHTHARAHELAPRSIDVVLRPECPPQCLFPVSDRPACGAY